MPSEFCRSELELNYLQHFFHYSITPLFGILFLGLIPFCLAKRKTALIISIVFGFLHLLLALFKINSDSNFTNMIMVYGLYFILAYLVFKLDLSKKHYILLWIGIFTLKIVTRSIYY